MSPFACPACSEILTWRQRAALSSRVLGRRLVTECPHCSARIAWAERPWRVVWIGTWTSLVGCLLGLWVLVPALFEGGEITSPLKWVMLVTLVIGCGVLCWGTLSLLHIVRD